MHYYENFIEREKFPGTEGNPFDIVLRGAEKLEKIPAIFVVLLLAFISLPAALGSWGKAVILFSFFLVDYNLLLLLPRLRLSFGPAKPPALMLAVMRLPFALLPLPAFLVFEGIGTVMVLYGFFIEPQRLIISRQTYHNQHFHPTQKLKLAHLGDLHMERQTPREIKILNELKAWKPDVILFSGDVLSISYLHDLLALNDARKFLSQLSAPMGVYCVSGSPAVDLPEILSDIYIGLPVKLLKNEKVIIDWHGQKLVITGCSCTHNPLYDIEQLNHTFQPGANTELSILLYHSPDLSYYADSLGIDLQFSGHTHGGQICLPLYGPIFTGSLFGRAFKHGRMQMKHLTLYILRGIGLEGAGAPRVRFLCPPEICFWEIG
jgi:predicted MPP superfamily phosphohydrolase